MSPFFPMGICDSLRLSLFAAFVALVGVLASIAARPADGATNSTEDRSDA